MNMLWRRLCLGGFFFWILVVMAKGKAIIDGKGKGAKHFVLVSGSFFNTSCGLFNHGHGTARLFKTLFIVSYHHVRPRPLDFGYARCILFP